MGPFEITKEMVADLTDELLRSLLEQLLGAEARVRRISPAGIAVGGNQTAGDGGIDGSISWQGAPDPKDWLPRRTIWFQCKAETMAAARIDKEMRPDGVPRVIFAELARKRGAYILFSTDDPSDSAWRARVAAMRTALAGVPNQDRIKLDFYGADKIARWANQHIGIATWLLSALGRPRGGWQPFGDWSAAGGERKPYLLDDTSRAKVAGVYVAMRDAIARMREELSQPGGVVRLIGLSGMGKTRLAEALFEDALDGGAALPRDRAIYADAGLDPAVSPALLAEQIATASTDAVIVVDNCTQRLHGQLAQIAKRGQSRASVLTIDYDVGGEENAGLLVALAENSELVLREILDQRFPKLNDNERRHLAEFSGGNARIALKVAEAGGGNVDLSKLKDAEMLERLFQVGRQEKDPTARACAEAASLVYAFYVSDGDGHGAEHAILAGIAGADIDTFYRNIAILLEWGVTQKRGPQRAVMPQPLANMLAAPFIRRSDPDRLIERFLAGPPRLLASFARRIGQLHDEPAAVEIARRLYSPTGPLGQPASLDSVAHKGFVYAAPAAPGDALEAIERSLAGLERSALVVPGDRRRDYSQLLVLIAHDPQFFDGAVAALAEFTLADGEVREELRARGHLLERFWPVLCFTLANQEQRLAALDAMLANTDERIVMLGVEALDHMLDAGHFSSSLNLEFGARSLLTEWRPYNGDGYTPWFKAAYERLVRLARGDGEVAARARAIVAQHFHEQVSVGYTDIALEAMREVRGNGFWEEGWRDVNDALHFEHRKDGEADRAALEALEQDLRPKTVDDFFDAFVLGTPWRHWHPSGRAKGSMRRVGLLARATGKALIRQGGDIAPYLERSTSAIGHNSVAQFAVALARTVPDLDVLWDDAYRLFAGAPETQRSPALLDGILQGAVARDRAWVDRKLDVIVTDTVLAEHLVILQTAVPLDATAIARFSTALQNGAIAPNRFALLMMGGVTKPVPGQVLADFLRQLFNRDDGVLPALQVLHMRIFGDRSDNVAIDPALTGLGRKMLADPRVYTSEIARLDHGITQIAEAALAGEEGSATARRVCVAMRRAERRNPHGYPDFDELSRTLMRAFPRVVLDEIVGRSTNEHLIGRFFGGWARNDEDFDPAHVGLDDAVLLDWAREDLAGRTVKLAYFIPYSSRHEDGSSLAWSPLALELIALAPDPAAVLRTFEQRFFSGGGSGAFALRFVRRRPLAAMLLAHPNVAVRAWAVEAARRIEVNIAHWDKADGERNSRFE